MRKVKIVLGVIVVLALVAVLGIVLFGGTLFRSVLNSSLADLRDSQGLQITFEDATYSLIGKVQMKGLKAVDLETRTEVASVTEAVAEFGWGGLLSDPVEIDRLVLQGPVLTYSPGLQDRFVKSEPASGVEEGVESASKEEQKSKGVLLTQFEISGGQVLFRQTPDADPQPVASVDLSASNVSTTTPFEFDVEIQAQGNNQGHLTIKGTLNPETLDCDVDLKIDRFSIAEIGPQLPPIDGQAKVLLKDRFSKVSTHGQLQMAEAPAAIPADIRSQDPFDLKWTIESDIQPDTGIIALETFRVEVGGLAGGRQELTGSGSLDPNSYQGGFALRGDRISAALFNPFIGDGKGVQIGNGLIAIDLRSSFSGTENPVLLTGKVTVADLAMRPPGEGATDIQFKAVELTLNSQYSKPTDRLSLNELSLRLDEIPLSLTGQIEALTDEKNRSLSILLSGTQLDLGRLVVLASPSFSEQGSLSGKADVNLSVTGQTASEGFPILKGNLQLAQVAFVPADAKDLKVEVTGKVDYDDQAIAAENLEVKLAGVTGNLSARVVGYNQPNKQVTATVRGVALQPVINLFNPAASGYLTGNADADLQAVIGQDNLPTSLDVTFKLSKATLFKTNPIPEAAYQTLGWEWLKGSTSLQEARGKVAMEGKGYRLSEVVLTTAQGGVTLAGLVLPGDQVDLVGETLPAGKGLQGKATLKARVNLQTRDATLDLGLESFSYPLAKGSFPKTSGQATASVSGDLSAVRSEGKIQMAEAPSSVPADLRAGTPFSLVWNVDATSQGAGQGATDIKNLDLSIEGLKGGTQSLTGRGSYDPGKGVGSLDVKSQGLSLPLLNPYIEVSTQRRILSGKADLDLKLARKGSDSPFESSGKLSLQRPAIKDLSGGQNSLKFEQVDLDFDGDYSPKTENLTLRKARLSVDGMPLDITGKVLALQTEKKRELALKIKGTNVDLARVIPLAAPDMAKDGDLRGKVNIDLSVSGLTSSDRFPILTGTADTQIVEYIPKKNPQQSIKVRGKATFDTEVLTAEGLDVKIADQPALVDLKVTGYNSPIKRVDSKIRGVPIEPLLEIYKPQAAGIISGKLDATIMAMLGQKEHPEALEIDFTITEGIMLTRHPIPSAIVQVVNWEWMRNGFPLTNAKGRIVQEGPGYTIQQLFLMGQKGGFTSRGTVGFDNKLNIEVRLNITKASVGELPSPIQKVLRSKEGSDWAYLGFDVGGTVSRPIPKPQFDNLLGVGVDRLTEQVREKYGDEIKEKTGVDTDQLLDGAGGALRGFLGGEK